MAPPAHRVVVCYFHRTVRCPTCQMLGGLVDEAVAAGFKKEVESKAVVFQMIDFQDKKNARLAEYYKITGPTLVLMDVRNSKVVAWKPLAKVWSLVGEKEKLAAHVQKEVRAYLEAPEPKKPAPAKAEAK